jgi:sugar-specific transcriptional regulator TrmB
MDKEAQTLIKLGLSSLQAQVYIELLKTGQTTPKQLSEKTGIDRSDAYKTLIKLRKMGLVEEKIARPKLFVALSTQYGISSLLQKKKNEVLGVENDAKEFLTKLAACKEKPAEAENMFVFFTRREESPARIKDQWNSAKTSIDLYADSMETIFDSFVTKFEYYYKALKRGVRIRILITSNDTATYERNKLLGKNLNMLCSTSKFEIRYCPENCLVTFNCFDKQESWIAVDSKKGLRERNILLSNSPQYTRLLNALFDRLWTESIPWNNNKATPALLHDSVDNSKV